MIPIELTCPLGHKCEEIKGEKLHRCVWFIEMQGTNPMSGEQLDEKGCAMAWMPVLLVENARVARGTVSAVESFRNTMERQGNLALGMQLIGAGPGNDTQPKLLEG